MNTSGIVVYRSFSPTTGLTESETTFSSLEELNHLILNAETPRVIDRIFIIGQDADGNARRTQFKFQSIQKL